MKLRNCMELIDSKIECIFARELSHEVATLITSEDPSKNSVSDCTMKESKGDEDKATLPNSELSNGQIKQTELLNGVLPKQNPNSKVPLELPEGKLSIPLEFSLSFSSSDENLSLSKEIAINGIPVESSYNSEGNDVFSEEDTDRTNSLFDFVDDSEKFGLSDSEVDKLLKDVDGKDKSDSSKSTKTNEEKENGLTDEKEERNNEMVTATIDEGAIGKSTNLADMILNNFEEKLHSGHELKFNCLFPNDKNDKSLTSKSDSDAANTNDNKEENTICQSGLSEKEIDNENKSSESSEHLSDCSLNSEVAQKSVTDETENTNEEIALNTAIESEVDSKANCVEIKNGSDSSHSSSVPECNNEQSGSTQLDDSNHRAFSKEENADIMENTPKTGKTQPHGEFLNMEVNHSETNGSSDDVEMQNVSEQQGDISDVEMQDDTSQLSSKSFDNSQNKNEIPSTHVKKTVETVNLIQSSSNSDTLQIEPDTNSCQDLVAPSSDNNCNSNERIVDNQPEKMEVTETAASIPENTDIIEKKVENLSDSNESTNNTSSNNAIGSSSAAETGLNDGFTNGCSLKKASVDTQSQLIGTHKTSHSISENTSSNNTENSAEIEDSGVKTVMNNDSNNLKCTVDPVGSEIPLADPGIFSNNEASTTSSDNAEDSVDIETPLAEPGTVSNNEASTSSGNAEDIVYSECPMIESQTVNDSESENNTSSNNTVDCIEIESSVNKTDVNNESKNCSDSKKTVDSVGSEIPLTEPDIVLNNESEASTSSDNAVDFVGSQNPLVEPDLIMDNKEVDKVGQKRSFNLEENSEREAKRTRVEESSSNDSKSSSQSKTGNNSAVETANEPIDSSEIKEKKGSSESTSEISKLKIKDSDLLIKCSDIGKISTVRDRTNCSVELIKKDKILTKDSPIVSFGCKRVHEPGNIIEVKKVRFTPEMERQLSIINSSEKFQNKMIRKDTGSEFKKGEVKIAIKLDSKGTKDGLEGKVECKKSDNLKSAVISKKLTSDTCNKFESEKVENTDKNEKLDTSQKDSEVEGKDISAKLEIIGNDEKPETEFSNKRLFSDTTIKKHNEEKSESTDGGEKCEIKSTSEKMEITSSEKLESNNAFDKLLETKDVNKTLQSEEAIKKFKNKDSVEKLESKDLCTSNRIESKDSSEKLESKDCSKKLEGKYDSEKVGRKDTSEKYESKGASDNFKNTDISEESESDVASEKSVSKNSSKKRENKDSSSKQSTTTREPESSVPSRSPKSNLDLAIERVALGLTDSDKEEEVVEEEEDNSAASSNPLPSVRNLRKNLLKNLSRFEWEELIVQKLTESISERSVVGDMRQRVQTQDQMLEYWRRKAQQLQKQLKDMEMVLKRYIGDARTRKERPIPVKITRSVGLQVHMGPMNQGMVRNRSIGNNEPPRNQGQVRRRANRVSSPVAGTMQQQQNQQQQTSQNQSPQQPHHQQQQHSQQQQQHPQQQQQTQPQRQTPVTGTSITSPLTVQKVVTAGYTKLTASTPQTIAPRPTITTQATAQSQISRMQKIAPAPSPIKSVTRPVQSLTITTTTGSSTSTISTVNSTAVSAANSLRIASAAQLNNRQPVKPTGPYTTTTKSGDLKIIDLTDEEDRAKANNLRTVQTSVANSMITNAVTSGVVPISSSSSIQAGSIRVVQPHQLTGTTTTTLLASSAPTPGNSRVAYFVPSTGVNVPQRQVLIASSAQQVRPGVMTVSSRQNQFSTLVLKNGAYVPLSQASGTQSVNTAILRSGTSMQSAQLQQVLPARPGQQIRVAPGLVTTVGRMPTPAITNVSTIASKHPAPLPNQPLYQPSNANWKCPPPKPELKISKGANQHQQGIVLSWNMTLTSDNDEIASYQLYAYQEGSAQPSTTLWKKVGDVKALPLPMACTLTQFMEGHKYHFAVRAVDVHMRVGPFSTPGNIVLTRK